MSWFMRPDVSPLDPLFTLGKLILNHKQTFITVKSAVVYIVVIVRNLHGVLFVLIVGLLVGK